MISNPIYFELIELGVIKAERIKQIHDRTRDKGIPVYLDTESKVIFLERYETDFAHYEQHASGNPEDPEFLRNGYYADDLRRFQDFKEFIKSAAQVLDFGCEWGGFINLASRHCSTVSGVELNDACLNYLRKKFPKGDFAKSIDHITTRPDLITSFHVLEHIPHQVETLKKIRNALADNGTLILEVPHALDFLIQTLDLPEFKDFTFWSEHLVLHTEDSLAAILKASGFKNFEIFPYQRYGFTNHLGWMLDRKPGGHMRYANLYDPELDAAYKQSRIRTKTSDTLIAIAKKHDF